ncbi:hypothetical protein Q7M76_00355 [Candidatus Liberibacter asiaticus]|uniref:Outer membrane lipoprotein n=2 Tax=Liberibacter asiaticus TaxID=34021 RepID=C6XHC9_LIBAP|nr:hypothetical protein [Candidatus Liberibacter asiaticus]ACT56672.1 outer membrane lipoprotein [Candidatus Liberibacter asiaticus str. psy62]AGH16440.1 outer membrane lipoprotein [Candidatus Liberibacter asiaticus str. gxpsy]ALK06851.1 hypothetical protein CD16_00365 [Candidatus Liberibacter asiaticus]ASK52319.1 hypothetical protein B2I23_00375 [Candidatus Liberibacter asiaticus]AWL13641.1 hypothetical protein DIC79_00390 [Candidatus Liberibacter asiaticus]
MQARCFLSLSFLFPLVAAIAVVSCSALSVVVDSSELLPEPMDITGYWEDDNGILSYFQKDGKFKTISTDGSSSVLATGSYHVKINQDVEIKLTSLIRNTSGKIQCQFLDSNKLNCLAKDQKQFYLRRTHLTELPSSKPQDDVAEIPEDPTTPSTSIIFYK